MPADKFEKAFGLPWAQALAEGRVFNALDACEALGVDAAGLDALWATAKKTKFGGGFYCGLVSVPGKAPIYVMNGFFMEMRSKFVTPGTSIHYYVVDFDPATLPWADFRAKVLGPTDPKDAPALVLPHNPPPLPPRRAPLNTPPPLPPSIYIVARCGERSSRTGRRWAGRRCPTWATTGCTRRRPPLRASRKRSIG